MILDALNLDAFLRAADVIANEPDSFEPPRYYCRNAAEVKYAVDNGLAVDMSATVWNEYKEKYG